MYLWNLVVNKVKEALVKHSNLSAGTALALAVVYYIKARSRNKINEVKLSTFLIALK